MKCAEGGQLNESPIDEVVIFVGARDPKTRQSQGFSSSDSPRQSRSW